MTKKEKQLEAFIEQAKQIAEDWVLAEVRGKDTHPEYANKMFFVYTLAKKVMNAEDDQEEEAED